MSDSVRLLNGFHFKRGDVVFWEIKGERSVIRVDKVKFYSDGFVLMNYTSLFPNIFTGCLMRQEDFSSLKNIKPLFNLLDQDFENFLELIRFMAMYEKIKTFFGGKNPVAGAFDEAMKEVGFKPLRIGRGVKRG